MTINDFSISFSTINGSGSATANTTIQKAIFYMGIPVSGRNIFPSNIQGLPTWYILRVNEAGYMGMVDKQDILIAMNPETIEDDINDIVDGGIVLLDKHINYLIDQKKNVHVYPMPVSEILSACDVPSHLEVYLANMVYVGVLSSLIKIDMQGIERALNIHFNGRRNAIEPNINIIKQSHKWAEHNLEKVDSYELSYLPVNGEKILVDGNTAAALGALFGGLQFSSWYPITPATSLAESLNDYIPKLRSDTSTGRSTCAVVQAEDELAAIGMVVGAGWAGLRAMTSTSGPGLCLMAEFLGLAYFAEVPLVVWDVQRVGPSTGLPTRTSQGDLSFTYFLSHGDKDFVILLPSNVNECFEFGWLALDIAEKLQTPVIVLSDLELGMNIWMTDKFRYPESPIDRGKLLWEEDLEKILAIHENKWGRYMDLDGDGIPYRTVPGNQHPNAPYFTRGTGHNEFARYSENPADWEKKLKRLKNKIKLAVDLIPASVVYKEGSASRCGVISFGSSDMPTIEAINKLEEKKYDLDYLKIRGIPFDEKVEKYVESHEKIFVIENNRDGQMRQILCVNFPDHGGKFISIARCTGLSLTAKWISEEIEKTMKRT